MSQVTNRSMSSSPGATGPELESGLFSVPPTDAAIGRYHDLSEHFDAVLATTQTRYLAEDEHYFPLLNTPHSPLGAFYRFYGGIPDARKTERGIDNFLGKLTPISEREAARYPISGLEMSEETIRANRTLFDIVTVGFAQELALRQIRRIQSDMLHAAFAPDGAVIPIRDDGNDQKANQFCDFLFGTDGQGKARKGKIIKAAQIIALQTMWDSLTIHHPSSVDIDGRIIPTISSDVDADGRPIGTDAFGISGASGNQLTMLRRVFNLLDTDRVYVEDGRYGVKLLRIYQIDEPLMSDALATQPVRRNGELNPQPPFRYAFLIGHL